MNPAQVGAMITALQRIAVALETIAGAQDKAHDPQNKRRRPFVSAAGVVSYEP